MIDRRQFLTAMGTAALAARAAHLADSGGSLPAIGLQLYSIRDEMKRDFDGSLQRVAAIGYTEVEFAGYFNRSPRDVRGMLDRVGLRAPSSHIPFEQLEKNLPDTLDAAHTIGLQYIVCPSTDPDQRRTLDECKRVAAAFNAIGAECRAAKIQFAYHNHDFDFAPIAGTSLYDFLLTETDPQLVKFEMDLYWIVKANRRPLDYFARYPGRFPMVHVKDMDHTPARGQTEVGRGIIDFKEIFEHADEAGIRHYFVEQEDLSKPWPSMKVNFEYLKKLRF